MKKWKRPMLINVTAEQLTRYICVAAKSIICWNADFR